LDIHSHPYFGLTVFGSRDVNAVAVLQFSCDMIQGCLCLRCSSTIRDKIIPHAVSWFTGEAVQDDDFQGLVEDEEGDDDEDDEDDEEDEDEEEEEDDDDDEEESKPKKKVHV